MKSNRKSAIETAQKSTKWGIILGTLGKQGNPNILYHLKEKCEKQGRYSNKQNISCLKLFKFNFFMNVVIGIS